MSRSQRGKRTPLESIVMGSAFTLIFGGLLLFRGDWWWAFPMVAAGIFPLVEGIRRIVSGKKESLTSSLEREAEAEKQILRAAQEQNGRLTVTSAALHTRLTIKEAQDLLEKMAREGHAAMNITNDGHIEFEFRDFLPPL